MAQDPQSQFRRGVACNPSTPPETLARLAEDPSEEVRRFLAQNKKCPPDLLRVLAKDPEPTVRVWVAAHKETPPDVIAALCADAPDMVQQKLATHRCTPRDVLRTYVSGPPETRRALATNPELPSECALELATTADDLEARALAGNPALPVELVRRFAADPRIEIRSAAAANRTLPPADALALLRDPSVLVREALAKRELDPTLHSALLDDPSPNIATALAQNPRLDAATYITLSQLPEGRVRAALVANPGVSPELLRRLSEDRSEEVVAAFAHAQNVPLPLFEEFLLRHLDNPVAWYSALPRGALSAPFLERVAREAGPALQQFFCQQSKLPVSVFVTLAQRAEPGILTHLAMNKALPSAALEVLAGHADANIRFWAGKNPNIDPQTLLRLAQGEEMTSYYGQMLCQKAAGHPRITGAELVALFDRAWASQKNQGRGWGRRRRYQEERTELLVTFIARPDLPVEKLEPLVELDSVTAQRALLARPDLPDAWRGRLLELTLLRCLQGTSPLARCCALMHPAAPVEMLASTVRNGGWIERWALTQNPTCPPKLLIALAEDANRLVREAARAATQRNSS